MGARVRLPEMLEPLLKSELEHTIREAAFHSDDELIVIRYIIEKVPQIDIAAELGWTRGTVASHIPYILQRISCVAERLYGSPENTQA